jgi:hypothetical protein
VSTRTVEAQFVFDRHGAAELSVAYRILVPERRARIGAAAEEVSPADEQRGRRIFDGDLVGLESSESAYRRWSSTWRPRCPRLRWKVPPSPRLSARYATARRRHNLHRSRRSKSRRRYEVATGHVMPNW